MRVCSCILALIGPKSAVIFDSFSTCFTLSHCKILQPFLGFSAQVYRGSIAWSQASAPPPALDPTPPPVAVLVMPVVLAVHGVLLVLWCLLWIACDMACMCCGLHALWLACVVLVVSCVWPCGLHVWCSRCIACVVACGGLHAALWIVCAMQCMFGCHRKRKCYFL